MWFTFVAILCLSSAINANLDKSQLRTFEEDVVQANYLALKTSYDVDILSARTDMLQLELRFTANDLLLDIEKLVRELLFPSDADRVVGEMNKTAESVVTNVVRLEDTIARLKTSLELIQTDLANENYGALSGGQLLLESYIANFNLTYDIGKENIILATNNLVLLLQNELEGIDDPAVTIVANLAEKIRQVLLTEQDYLNNAKLSFDQNEVALLEVLSKIIGQVPNILPFSTEKTTTMSIIPPTSTTPASTTISIIPTTSPTSTISIIPTTPPTSTTFVQQN